MLYLEGEEKRPRRNAIIIVRKKSAAAFFLASYEEIGVSFGLTKHGCKCAPENTGPGKICSNQIANNFQRTYL